VTALFYSNGETIPKKGIAVNIRNKIWSVRKPSIQKNANAKSNTEQRACTARVRNDTASTDDINRENAHFVCFDRSHAATSHAIKLCNKPVAIDLLSEEEQEKVWAKLKGYRKDKKDQRVKIGKRKRDELDARTHQGNTCKVNEEFIQPVNRKPCCYVIYLEASLLTWTMHMDFDVFQGSTMQVCNLRYFQDQ